MNHEPQNKNYKIEPLEAETEIKCTFKIKIKKKTTMPDSETSPT